MANCYNFKKFVILGCLMLFLSIRAVVLASDFSVSTIEIIDDLAVMEVSGNYDANLADGSINTIPRQEIAKEFFKTHPDNYDFLVIFSNFDFLMPENEAVAFYQGVRNGAQGIGQPIFDNSSLELSSVALNQK